MIFFRIPSNICQMFPRNSTQPKIGSTHVGPKVFSSNPRHHRIVLPFQRTFHPQLGSGAEKVKNLLKRNESVVPTQALPPSRTKNSQSFSLRPQKDCTIVVRLNPHLSLQKTRRNWPTLATHRPRRGLVWFFKVCPDPIFYRRAPGGIVDKLTRNFGEAPREASMHNDDD